MFSLGTLKKVLALAQEQDEPGVVRYCLNGSCTGGVLERMLYKPTAGLMKGVY